MTNFQKNSISAQYCEKNCFCPNYLCNQSKMHCFAQLQFLICNKSMKVFQYYLVIDSKWIISR